MHFFVTDDGDLIHLPDFDVVQGRQSVVRIRALGRQVVTMPGRREPDRLSFTVPPTARLQLGLFRVVDHEANVYHCIAESVNMSNGVTTATGFVHTVVPADQLQAARQAVQQAVEAVRAEPGAAADGGAR